MTSRPARPGAAGRPAGMARRPGRSRRRPRTATAPPPPGPRTPYRCRPRPGGSRPPHFASRIAWTDASGGVSVGGCPIGPSPVTNDSSSVVPGQPASEASPGRRCRPYPSRGVSELIRPHQRRLADQVDAIGPGHPEIARGQQQAVRAHGIRIRVVVERDAKGDVGRHPDAVGQGGELQRVKPHARPGVRGVVGRVAAGRRQRQRRDRRSHREGAGGPGRGATSRSRAERGSAAT